MSKHLILGGAGFIGSNLAKKLVSEGIRPTIFTRPTSSLINLASILDNVDIIYGDWTDENILSKIIQGANIVYHLITTTFPSSALDSSIYDIQSNLIPTVRLLELCTKFNVQKLIYASSGGTVYGDPQFTPITEEHPLNPRSLYGQSKVTIEKYLQFYARLKSLNVIILRISNPFGSGQKLLGVQGLVAVAMGCVVYNRPISIYGQGEAIRDYIYIEDVVEAIHLSAQNPSLKSAILNISSGQGKSIIEVILAIEKVVGKSITKEFIPSRSGDVNVSILSNDLARETLGWFPSTEFTQAIQSTWQYVMRQNTNE